MLSELDFSYWQSYVVVILVVSVYVLGIVASICSLYVVYWWMMSDIIEHKRYVRRKRTE